jgi:hypothetical protein
MAADAIAAHVRTILGGASTQTVYDVLHALTGAGLVVMAGTEHNTPGPLPLEPACADGPCSETARRAFYTGVCVVAAHAADVQAGGAGYSGPDSITVFAAAGDRIVRGGGR